MTEKIIGSVIVLMSEELNSNQLKKLQNVLTKVLADVEVQEKETSLTIPTENWERVLQEYFVSMKVEGRSDNTIKQYKNQLKAMN